MNTTRFGIHSEERDTVFDLPFPGETETADAPAWEEIDTGRFMPRRIRGSFRGGELG